MFDENKVFALDIFLMADEPSKKQLLRERLRSKLRKEKFHSRFKEELRMKIREKIHSRKKVKTPKSLHGTISFLINPPSPISVKIDWNNHKMKQVSVPQPKAYEFWLKSKLIRVVKNTQTVKCQIVDAPSLPFYRIETIPKLIQRGQLELAESILSVCSKQEGKRDIKKSFKFRSISDMLQKAKDSMYKTEIMTEMLQFKRDNPMSGSDYDSDEMEREIKETIERHKELECDPKSAISDDDAPPSSVFLKDEEKQKKAREAGLFIQTHTPKKQPKPVDSPASITVLKQIKATPKKRQGFLE